MSQIRTELSAAGYSMARGAHLQINRAARTYEEELASEWDNLEPDNYLKNGATFRQRRYGRFYYLPRTNTVRLLAHQPYYQSENANGYAGGIHRIVAPLTELTVKNPLMTALIEFDFAQFPVAPHDERREQPWEVACHQFRIIGRAEQMGEPTPEGIHRDEIDFGAIHLMSRSNAAGGRSRVYDDAINLLGDVCLESRLDTLFWDDQKVLHAVTPIRPQDPATNAVRDVLILGYKCSPGLTETD